MWPAIRDAFLHFFTDKDYFLSKWDKWVNKVRTVSLVLGAAIALPGDFHDSVMKMIPPKYVQVAGLFFMGLGVFLRAGDKTPENVKALATAITPPEVQKVVP